MKSTEKKGFLHRVVDTCRVVVHGYTSHNVGLHGASAAFYLLLSVIPFVSLIAIAFVASLVFVKSLNMPVDQMISELIADDSFSISDMLDQITSSSSMTFVAVVGAIVSVITVIWSASKLFYAINKGLEDIYGFEKHTNYFLARFKACVYTMLLVILLIILLIMLLIGNHVIVYLSDRYPGLSTGLRITSSLSYLVIFFATILIVAAVYRMVAGRDKPFRVYLPGAIFAMVACAVFTLIFVLYQVAIMGNSSYATDSMLGTVSVIAVCCLWTYACCVLFFMGAMFNEEHRHWFAILRGQDIIDDVELEVLIAQAKDSFSLRKHREKKEGPEALETTEASERNQS